MLHRPRPCATVAACWLCVWHLGPAGTAAAAAWEEAEDLYEMLGVAPDASAEDLKRAYRRKSMGVHPDKCSAADRESCERRFIALSRAYEALADPASRKAYDGARTQRQRRAAAGTGGPKGDNCWGQGYSWDRCCSPRRPAAERAQCWDGWYTEENCCGGGGGGGGSASGDSWDELFSHLRTDKFDLASAVRTFAHMAGNDPSMALAVQALARYAAGQGVDWERVGKQLGDKLQAGLRNRGHGEAADWLSLGREAWRAASEGDWARLGRAGKEAMGRFEAQRQGEGTAEGNRGPLQGLMRGLGKLFGGGEL